jgi:capsular polysaccharide biosynthesis protein
MDKELHDKAWNLLDEKGLTTGEKMMVRSSFASTYQNEYPYIVVKNNMGGKKYYVSGIEEIKILMFNTKNEVILANAIYENVKDKFNLNEFIHILKFTFRIMKVSSEWD